MAAQAGHDPLEVTTAHTADLAPGTLAAARALLHDVFEGELTEDDWEHSLGGVHALAWEQGILVGHASVVQRRLMHGDRALRTGYIEGVGVRADRRRRGVGGRLMDALEAVVRGAYDLGALAATEEAMPFYESRGWRLWQGATFALTPEGVTRTEDDDGCVYVLPVTATLDIAGELTCDWRDGDPW